MKNILYITNEINRIDGVTNHIYLLVKGISEAYGGKIFLIAGGGNNQDLFDFTHCELIINPLFRHQERSVFKFSKAVKFLTGFLKNNNIGIIHAHNHYAANIAHYASRFTNARTIQTNHGLFQPAGRLKHFRAEYHIVLNRKISDYLAKNGGVSLSRIKLIKPGIKNETADHFLKDKKLFLSASRFSKEKSLDTYIAAANILNISAPGEYKFYLSGEGKEENELKKLNDKSGGAVIFAKGDKQYRELMSTAGCFVFPSKAKEGLPTVLLQSIAAGCLVISSSFDGIADLYPEPFDKLLFTAGDAEQLSERMLFSVKYYEELKKIYSPVHENIISEYSLGNMIKKHLELYKEISEA